MVPDALSTTRALRRMERERAEEQDAQRAVWAFLWILFAFKIVTVGLIWYVALGSGESMGMILATTWYWLLIPVVAISGPALVRWRMMQMRKRRARLLQAEFAVEPTIVVMPDWFDDREPGTMRPRD